MMKTLVLLFTIISMLSYGQQKNRLVSSANDSVAVKNVKSIFHYSKKTFSTSDFNIYNVSDLNKNVNQLLLNTLIFNSAINNLGVNQLLIQNSNNFENNTFDMIGDAVVRESIINAK